MEDVAGEGRVRTDEPTGGMEGNVEEKRNAARVERKGERGRKS
jgi:hypothetical protein